MSDLPIVFEHRCKICNLAKTNPDIFKDLHFQVLEVGLSMNRAMNYINSRIDNENLQLTKINNQNMSVHFASHITLPDRVNMEIAKASSSPDELKTVNNELGSYVEDLVRRKVGNDVNDYLNLDQLRAQLMDKLQIMDDLVARETEDGHKMVDLDAMSQYTSLVKEVRGCITDVNKIRQSKQLMNVVIKSLIEKSTFQIVQNLLREYDQIKQDMIDADVDQAVITKVDHRLRIKLAEVVSTTARAAVEDIIRLYKLR